MSGTMNGKCVFSSAVKLLCVAAGAALIAKTYGGNGGTATGSCSRNNGCHGESSSCAASASGTAEPCANSKNQNIDTWPTTGNLQVLVAGGAGYIASHTIVCLLEQGYDVTIVDNLVNRYV